MDKENKKVKPITNFSETSIQIMQRFCSLDNAVVILKPSKAGNKMTYIIVYNSYPALGEGRR